MNFDLEYSHHHVAIGTGLLSIPKVEQGLQT